MELFIVKDGKVAVTPQVLLLTPFKEIWSTYSVEESIVRFGYIEFMCSHKKTNPFIGYKLGERPVKILMLFSPNRNKEYHEGIMNDPLVIRGIKVYDELQFEASPTLRLHNAAESAADKMVDFFTTFDLDKTNARTGSLLYKPADITRALKDVNDVIRTMSTTKQKVIQEIDEDAKGKGGREINYFEKSKGDR